jgi:hypothetical protein
VLFLRVSVLYLPDTSVGRLSQVQLQEVFNLYSSSPQEWTVEKLSEKYKVSAHSLSLVFKYCQLYAKPAEKETL